MEPKTSHFHGFFPSERNTGFHPVSLGKKTEWKPLLADSTEGESPFEVLAGNTLGVRVPPFARLRTRLHSTTECGLFLLGRMDRFWGQKVAGEMAG